MTEGHLFPVTLDLSPDLRVLSLTMSVAILTGILFGLAPRLACLAEDPATVLQQNARSLGSGAGKLNKALIITQVALSMVLLLGAGLFVPQLPAFAFPRPRFQKRECSKSPCIPGRAATRTST